MIDPQWQVVDLDPITWRNLGRFLEPQHYIAAAQPEEHGLFVLHDQGHVLNVVDTQTRSRPAGIPAEIADPLVLAQELFQQGNWQRVHIIDRQHLAWVARQAQATPHRELSLDAYYHMVSELIWGKSTGYVCVPPRTDNWHGWTYTEISHYIQQLSLPASLALGVYSDTGLSIGLILVCEHGRIRTVTTFEALDTPLTHLGVTEQTCLVLCEALQTQFAPPVAILVCNEAVFSGWLTATDKVAYLVEARKNLTAFWVAS